MRYTSEDRQHVNPLWQLALGAVWAGYLPGAAPVLMVKNWPEHIPVCIESAPDSSNVHAKTTELLAYHEVASNNPQISPLAANSTQINEYAVWEEPLWLKEEPVSGRLPRPIPHPAIWAGLQLLAVTSLWVWYCWPENTVKDP